MNMELNEIFLNGLRVIGMLACTVILIRLVVFCLYGAIKHLNRRGGSKADEPENS